MTGEEMAAIEWLVANGIKREDIRFQGSRSPDIVTPGKAYEVKRIHAGNAISFSGVQLRGLSRWGSFSVLVYNDGKLIAEVPGTEIINRSQEWHPNDEVNFHIYYEDSSLVVNTRLQPALYRELEKMSKECGKSTSDLVRDAIQAMIGMYLHARKK